MALVNQRARFVHVVATIHDHPLVACVPPPPSYADGYPCRITHLCKTPENPDGWSVEMPDQRLLSGREFTEQYPGFDQTLLPSALVGGAIRLALMVEHGRDPVTGDVRTIPPTEPRR